MGAALEAILNACSPVRFVVPHGKHLGCRADAGVVNNASDAEDRVRRMTPVAAPPEQQTQVATLSRAFEGMVLPSTQATPECRLVGPQGESVAIPDAVFHVLTRVVEVLARGDSVAVCPWIAS